MLSRAQKIRLGAFLTVGSLLLLLILAAIAGSRLVEKSDIYYISFENYSVSGLQVGGTVHYRGIKVGRVEDIKIDPKDLTKVIITISVERGTPIKVDTEATLAFMGITGIKAVEISGGTNEAAILNPKSYIKTGATMIDDISDRAISIADKIDIIASNISNLTDEENRRNISQILSQTSLLLEDTRANLSTTIKSLNQVASTTATLAGGLNSNITRITDAFVNNVNKLTETSSSSITDLSKSTQSNLTRLTDSATSGITGVTDNANRVMNRMSDDVSQKLDLLTKSATGNLDSLSMATKSSIETLVAQLGRELDLISSSLDKSINEINSNAGLLLADTRTQLNQLGNSSNQMILGVTGQIAELSAQINRSLERVNSIIASPALDNIVTNLDAISGQLTKVSMQDLVAELVSTLNKAGTAISNIDRTILRNRANLNETLESLREASANLNDFTRQIADQPSIIIRGN